jgi:acyl carrier protein
MPEYEDSLDIVELVMAAEQALDADPGMPPHQREQLIRDITARIARCQDDLGPGKDQPPDL